MLTIDKITSYIGYRESFLWFIYSNLLKWMFEGDSVGPFNAVWMLQKCSLNLFVAEYAFLIMVPSLSWMWFVAKLDLRPVFSFMHYTCGYLFLIFGLRVHGIIETNLFWPENQGLHFISPNFIVIHIFLIVKFVSSVDGIKNVLIHPARLLTIFLPVSC